MIERVSTVQVDLGPRSYPVLIGSGLLQKLGSELRSRGFKHTNAFVLTNEDLGTRYFDATQSALVQFGFKRVVQHRLGSTGEDAKSWDELSKACSALLESFPEAGSVPLILLLGGGVIGDLGGFAAGIFRRGVPFVQIPTSLLAMVDSSVGGKVAVNFAGVKNVLGIFNQPRLVCCDLDLLKSLPEKSKDKREVRSGVSEIIKYGAVCSQKLFEQLEGGALEKLLQLDEDVLDNVVTQCVTIKARVVEQDEFDKKGVRNVLNFGHTIGHALELATANPDADRETALSHGEAIGIGMVAATQIARELRMVASDFEMRLRKLIAGAGLYQSFSEFRTKHPSDRDYADKFDRVKRALQLDKKFREGRNVFVLPTGIGQWEQRENVDWGLVDDAIRSSLA